MTFVMIAWGFIQKGFSAVLAFCSKPPGSWIAAALAVALGFWWFGQHEFNRGKEACEAAHAQADAAHAKAASAITFNVEAKAAAEVAKITAVSDTIKREIPTHVTKKADASCPVTNGFNSVFNAAATNSPPASDPGNDDAPSDVTLSTIAEVTAENDETYYIVAARLKEWQDWYAKQQAVPR